MGLNIQRFEMHVLHVQRVQLIKNSGWDFLLTWILQGVKEFKVQDSEVQLYCNSKTPFQNL